MSWPEDELEAVPACPVCGAAERTPLYDGLTDRIFGIAPGTWTMVRCAACASAFLDPRPTVASLGRAYAGGYVTHAAPVPDPEPASGVARLRRRIRDGYLNRRLGYGFADGSGLGAVVDVHRPLKAETDRNFRHLRLPRPGARLLDVGCGNGTFVLRMRDSGWDARGQDIDAEALAEVEAAGIPVTATPLEELAVSEAGSYAAVTASHVVEHVHEPEAFLRRLFALLEPGGQVWLATPNLASAGHARFGRDWMALDPPRHLVLFNRESLRRAVAAAGFVDVRFPAPWSGGGGIFATSSALARGERPDLTDPGTRSRDLIGLVRPESAEELVVVATKPSGAPPAARPAPPAA